MIKKGDGGLELLIFSIVFIILMVAVATIDSDLSVKYNEAHDFCKTYCIFDGYDRAHPDSNSVYLCLDDTACMCKCANNKSTIYEKVWVNWTKWENRK